MTTRGRIVLLIAGDAVALVVSLAAALSVRQLAPVGWHALVHHLTAFAPLFAAWLAVLYVLGLYDIRSLRRLSPVLQQAGVAAAVNWMLGVTYFYFADPWVGLTPKTNLLLAIVFFHGGILLWRQLWRRLQRLDSLRQTVTILGSSGHAAELRAEMRRHPELGFEPRARSGRRVDLLVAEGPWIERRWRSVRSVFAAAIRRGAPIVSLHDFYESFFGKILLEAADQPGWLLDHVLSRRHRVQATLKRVFDWGAAAGLLVAVLPLMGAIALLVRAVDGAPVLFAQRRVGRYGGEFSLLKFRTMAGVSRRVFPDGSGDRRTTALGRILRRFRLDELPQLFNVLRGDMSLVGPRPETVPAVRALERMIPHYHLRHLVRPGITGWAQTSYWAVNSPRTTREKLRYDLYYLKNASLTLDLIIVLRTIRRLAGDDASWSRAPRGPEGPRPGARGPRVDIGLLLRPGGRRSSAS